VLGGGDSGTWFVTFICFLRPGGTSLYFQGGPARRAGKKCGPARRGEVSARRTPSGPQAGHPTQVSGAWWPTFVEREGRGPGRPSGGAGGVLRHACGRVFISLKSPSRPRSAQINGQRQSSLGTKLFRPAAGISCHPGPLLSSSRFCGLTILRALPFLSFFHRAGARCSGAKQGHPAFGSSTLRALPKKTA